MRALIDSRELARAAGHVARVIDKTGQAAGMAMSITVTDTQTILEATGPRGWSRSQVDAKGIEPGQTVVNGLWLTAMSGALPQGETDMEERDGRLRLSCAGASLDMSPMGGDLTPTAPTLPQTRGLPDGTLERLGQAVAHCLGNDPNLPVLTGIRLAAKDGILTATGTNRVCASQLAMPAPGLDDMDAIVPGEWLVRNAKGATGIGVDAHACAVTGERDADTSPVIDGQYPNIDRLWPTPGDIEQSATVDKTRLEAACRLLRTAWTSGGLTTPIRLEPQGDALVLRLSDESTGATQRLDATIEGTLRDDAHPVVLDATYLANAAKATEGQTVTIGIRTGADRIPPVLLTGESEGQRQLITPITIG